MSTPPQNFRFSYTPVRGNWGAGHWAKLARNLKAEIDPDLIEAYRGTVSLPFELGKHKCVAIKVIDDRGIESLKVISL